MVFELLTVLISITVAYIAYQQYKTNNSWLQFETYEKKLKIYKSVKDFLREFQKEGQTNYERCYKFYSDTLEAIFLFDKSVQKHIEAIFYKSIEIVELKTNFIIKMELQLMWITMMKKEKS